MERQGRIGRFIDLSAQLQGKQHVGSVFFIGSVLLYLMLLFHRDTLVLVEIKPLGTTVNETTDYFQRRMADNPEKLRGFVTREKVGQRSKFWIMWSSTGA